MQWEIIQNIRPCYIFLYYRPQGNNFRNIRHSVHKVGGGGGGVCCLQGWVCIQRGGLHPGGLPIGGFGSPSSRGTRKASGMHPTRMHSCSSFYKNLFSKKVPDWEAPVTAENRNSETGLINVTARFKPSPKEGACETITEGTSKIH